jgi:hypothetical protein
MREKGVEIATHCREEQAITSDDSGQAISKLWKSMTGIESSV